MLTWLAMKTYKYHTPTALHSSTFPLQFYLYDLAQAKNALLNTDSYIQNKKTRLTLYIASIVSLV